MSKSVAKAPIAPERRKRNVDIPRFFSRPIPARGAFATDLDKLRPGPSQESHASHWAGRRFTTASLNGDAAYHPGEKSSLVLEGASGGEDLFETVRGERLGG